MVSPSPESERAELVARFSLKSISDGNRAAFRQALAAVERQAARRVTIDEAQAWEAAGWWFVPHKWLGCRGQLVDKATLEVTPLGSQYPLALCFWAYERGALKRPCTLVIDRVRDRALALELMARLEDDPASLLAQVPARLPAMDLWYALPTLAEAEARQAFDFHLE